MTGISVRKQTVAAIASQAVAPFATIEETPDALFGTNVFGLAAMKAKLPKDVFKSLKKTIVSLPHPNSAGWRFSTVIVSTNESRPGAIDGRAGPLGPPSGRETSERRAQRSRPASTKASVSGAPTEEMI